MIKDIGDLWGAKLGDTLQLTHHLGYVHAYDGLECYQ